MRTKCERRYARVVAGVAIIGVLAGCAATRPVPTTVAVAGMQDPERALQESMRHVEAETAELGRLSPQAIADGNAHPLVPDDLQRIISFDWSGSLDDGVTKLAASVGYTAYVTGPVNTAPITVSVQVDHVPALRAFQALGEQAGAAATVEVDPQHHRVQVIHHA